MNLAASRMEHILELINVWKPATLQLFEEGRLNFVDHLSMAASRRIMFFTQSVGGKNKVVISEAFMSSCSHFCRMRSELKQAIF